MFLVSSLQMLKVLFYIIFIRARTNNGNVGECLIYKLVLILSLADCHILECSRDTAFRENEPPRRSADEGHMLHLRRRLTTCEARFANTEKLLRCLSAMRLR